MEEWKEYKLGEVALPVRDRIDTSDLDTSSYISTENMLPDKAGVTLSSGIPSGKAIHFKNEDVLISNIRPYFKKIWRADKVGGCSADVICLRASKEIEPLFLYYLMSQDLFFDYVMQGTKGTKMPRGDRNQIMQWPVLLPSKSEQRNITSILSALDDKIEINRRINDNLEQQAQALFNSWFVDFEPFKNGEFVESELGMIPKGWRVYTMEELVERVGGYSYKGNELQDSTTAMATIKNFERNGGFKINGFKEIVPSSKAKHEQFLKKFDVIIAHTDLTQNADIIGNPALILHFGKYDRLIMSMDLVKVKSKSDYITYGLLYCFFSDARFKSHALGYVNGTTVLHLSKKAIPDYKLALPNDLSILAKFGKTFDSIFAKEAEMMEETDRLASLRDTLLPKLMSGELKVNEVY